MFLLFDHLIKICAFKNWTANADDSNSKATGTLDLDEQVSEQEVQEEDDVEEDEWGIRKLTISNSNVNGTQDFDKLDKDQEVQEENNVEEQNWRVKEAIDREGEDETPAGVPLASSLNKK